MSELLPEELVIQILARLSIKDLARIKCVCKIWRNLINHRGFAERYRVISPVKILSFFDKGFYLLDVEDKNPVLTNRYKLDFPLDQSMMIDESTCVLHFDGMLCVTLKNHTLMVWNPYSNQFKIVPNQGMYRDSSILGFGYDSVLNDYKVVTFLDRLESSTAHVFGFRDGSWKETIRIPYPDWHYRERRGTFLDQHLYWIAYRSNVDRFILSYNLSTDEYRKIPLPVYNQSVACSWLGVTCEKLCLIDYEPCENAIHVSVMEKTGSWNEIISLSISNLIDVHDWIRDYQVDFMSFTKKNNLFVTFTEYLDRFETSSEEREKKKVLLYKTGDDTFVQVPLRSSLAEFRFLGEYVETPLITTNRFLI